jgi:hypothetical protein
VRPCQFEEETVTVMEIRARRRVAQGPVAMAAIDYIGGFDDG